MEFDFLKDLVDEMGLYKTKNLTGIDIFHIIKLTKMKIDNPDIAYEVFIELFSSNKIPKKYKGFKLELDYMSGTIYWTYSKVMDFSGEEYIEKMISMATPFWDGNSNIPVDTEIYEILDARQRDETVIMDDLQLSELINVSANFENIEQFLVWIRDFYYPEVYKILIGFLRKYRESNESYLI